jgi:hypothetical protein
MSQSQRQQRRQEGSAVSTSSSYPSSSSSPSRNDDDDINIGESRSQQRLQMIDTLKAPIIERGRSLGYEVIENYDLGAGVIHVVWLFKPGGSESLPDMKLGFICLTEYSEFSLNSAIARALLNVVDKLVIVVPNESMTKPIKDSIESMPQNSIVQLRKYITVLTPTTLVSKTGIAGSSKDRDNSQTGEVI